MKNKNTRSKGVIKKRRMTRRIRHSVLMLSLTGLISIVYLCSGLNSITTQYTDMSNQDYRRVEILNNLKDKLYQHQSCLLELAVTTSPEIKNSLELQTEELKTGMLGIISSIDNDFSADSYIAPYNSLQLNLTKYLNDSENVLEHIRSGKSSESKTLIEETLLEHISDVNTNFDSFDNIVRKNMSDAKVRLEKDTSSVYFRAIILLIILIIASVSTQIISIRISNEMINSDPVTGIPNYDKFFEHCSKKKIRKNFADYSIVCANIKGFQYINQQYGTEFGDYVLTEYAQYLRKAAAKEETAARINGDSFIMLIKRDRVAVIADYLKQVKLDIHSKDGTRKITVDSRLGIYEIESKTDIADAVSNAQTALKEAKSSANSDCVWYSSEMTENEIAAKETLAKFKSAIKNEEFVVYYQPKVNMIDDKLCGCEALVRWIRDGKMIPPFKFIPVLEDEGYITELDFYVFEHVCRHISEWKAAGIEPVRISSNFSKLHLKNKRFADDILDIIEKYKVDKQYIEIELTESSGYDDFEAMTEFVNKMKSEKIFTAIDDFGTGYSSLSILKDLDIDVVKLDKSFLSGAEDEAHKKMIENVVRMINDLHRKVICEGVETKQQADFLKSVECFLAQGYLYDKPLPHDDFEARLIDPKYVLNQD